ncbi:MAG TPA: TetR/AcrR family transcriptional regulator [Pyrinomonadaceae bacterium]|nr:TetR/AcrR family transcriptional regulator [Pyrinomonadaceae bacterium]
MKAQKRSAVKDERRAEIYRTAAQIILRKGYDATSVNDIADALGITKAGLYHYVSGKKDLLFDIMSFGLDELDEEVARPAQAIADAEARLRFVITTHASMVTRGQGAITILVDEITALTPAQNRKITRRKREYFDCLRSTLDQLKAEGKLRDVNTTAAAFNILGMISWLSRWFRHGGELDDRQVGEEILKIALGGILRPEARAPRHGLQLVNSE